MDRQSLAAQYATSANLAARIALHERCSTNRYGWQRWVFDRLGLQPGMRVLEIGAGTGSLWSENADRLPTGVEIVLSDFSIAMLKTAKGHVAFALPDVPFADRSFDAVIANHMLYHVEDRQRGLAGIRRVLRDGGTLFAATNGAQHLREIKELMSDFGIAMGDVSSSFTLENGDGQLRGVFPHVEREDYPDSFRIADPELLLGYIASVGPEAAEVVGARREEIRAAIEKRMAADGAFHVVKSTGLFGARATPPPAPPSGGGPSLS